MVSSPGGPSALCSVRGTQATPAAIPAEILGVVSSMAKANNPVKVAVPMQAITMARGPPRREWRTSSEKNPALQSR
jgi:hypothetical protein